MDHKHALLREHYSDVYTATFIKRPLGMLVEDRDGMCTVVELQCEDGGRPGQAEQCNVSVKDAIVTIENQNVLNTDFNSLTKLIKSAKPPFSIGFARHVDNLYKLQQQKQQSQQEQLQEQQQQLQQQQLLEQQHHHHQAPPLPNNMKGVAGGGLAEMKEENAASATNGRGIGGGGRGMVRTHSGSFEPNGSSAKRMRRNSQGSSDDLDAVVLPPPPPTAAQMAAAAAAGANPVMMQRHSPASAARPHPAATSSSSSSTSATSAPTLQQHLAQMNNEGQIAQFLRAAVNQQADNLDGMLEQLGRRALLNFARSDHKTSGGSSGSKTDGGKEEDSGVEKEGEAVVDACASSSASSQLGVASAAASQLCAKGLNPDAANAIQKLKEHYVRLRNMRLENRIASSSLNEYCRAMLERAHSLAYIETQVSELLTTRVLEIRERVLELRSMDPGADRQLLAEKWTLANEQRRNHLHSRQIVHRTLSELEHLVTEVVPLTSQRIDVELQAHIQPLDGLMREFTDLENVVREVMNQGGGPKATTTAAAQQANTGGGMRNSSSTATLATLQSDAGAGPGSIATNDDGQGILFRPTLFSGSSGSGGLEGGDNGGRSTAVRVHHKRKPVHMGSAYQVPDSGLPSAYASDVAFEMTNCPTLPREGEEICRWKPAPEGKDLPSAEDIEAFASQFPGKYEEEVLWELYKLGWDMCAAKLRLSQMVARNQLARNEALVHEPFTANDVRLFEGAMTERWKDFYHAARVLRKSTRSCIVFYYDHWKKTEAYQRIRPQMIPVQPDQQHLEDGGEAYSLDAAGRD